jgi:Protein of unknown function (DUF2933)
MSMHDRSEHEGHPQGSFLTSRAGFVLFGFLAIAGALLFTEHRAHVFGVLIWLPLLACPLMHMFMHGGHGGHSDHRSHGRQEPDRSAP